MASAGVPLGGLQQRLCFILSRRGHRMRFGPLASVVLLAAAVCCTHSSPISVGGGDAAMILAPADLSLTGDLARSGAATPCGADGIQQSCAAVSGPVDCYICLFSPLGGQCAAPCRIGGSDCAPGQRCYAFPIDAGATIGFALEGHGCASMGACY
jgi:hypothetical protein